MQTTPEIHTSLLKAKDFLLKSREPDGFWSIPNQEYRLPAHYQTQFVKTAHACHALFYLQAFLSDSERSALEESLFNAVTYPLSRDMPIDYHALKLLLSAYSNTDYAAQARKDTVKYILSEQRQGFWKSYSNTYHFTNFYILDALQQNDIPAPSSFTKWALNSTSTKGHGWGFSKNDSPQVSTTATLLFASLLAGLSFQNPKAQDIAKWLEHKQNDDGGWPASNITEAVKSTYHSTANTLFCLLLIDGDVERKSVQKGLTFLLRGQRGDGSWPHTTADPATHIFTIDYIVGLLSFINFLKEARSPQHSFLQNCLSPTEFARYMYSAFMQQMRSSFLMKTSTDIYFTRAIGSTSDAQERRRDILHVLSRKSPLDDAELIDELKAHDEKAYAHMRKKNHLTLIKNDLQYLESLHLVRRHGRKHFVVVLPPPLSRKSI